MEFHFPPTVSDLILDRDYPHLNVPSSVVLDPDDDNDDDGGLT